MQRKRKSRQAGSHSTLSLLRKELREGNLQSFFGGSSCTVSSNSAPDPLLSSFILPMVDDFVSVQPNFSRETRTTKKSTDVNKSERNVKSSPLSVKDQEEKAKRCEFVQGLLLSTICLMKFYKTTVSGSNRLLQCNREPESHGEIGLTMKSPRQANLQIYGSLLCL